MEVVDACSSIVSNKEVLDLLKATSGKKHTNLATILYETTSYLESSPVSTYSIESLSTFLNLLKERNYSLTKLEKIQLVNLKPQNETELHLIIDNIEEKLNDEQRNELLTLIQSTLVKVDGSLTENSRKKIKR